ncbi:MAG: hypothetical protein N3F66_13065 [Spirochaetes bacterium]|nr:hypothetical protein [Spirochaetota bacterium]
MKRIYILIFFCFTSLLYTWAQDCIIVPFSTLRMLAESRVDPCPICQKKLQKQALTFLSKEIYPKKYLYFDSSCTLIKSDRCMSNELLLTTNYDDKITINGKEATLPFIIFKFYTQQHHIVGIDEKDYTNDAIETKYLSLINNKPVVATIEVVSYKYGDFPSLMYMPERNALIIHCKVTALQQVQ